jgi:hypothetical protein
MSTLVGVHGIAQQQVGRHQLRPPWALALADGLERSSGHRVPVPPLDVAFYGDLFLSGPADAETGKDAAAGDEALWDTMTAAAISHVISAAGEILSGEELAAAQEPAPEKGLFGRVPLPLQATLRALDRRFGSHAGALFVGELQQVRRYLTDPALKAQADRRVTEAVTEDCRVLIGHSLGSVVALEFLRHNPARRVELFVTLGSPLGLRAVRSLMPDPGFGAATGVSPNVGTWVNLRDVRDPVACAGNLARWWPGVTDDVVDNQKAAHSVERYLSKKQTGDAVLGVLPELAS